jgi:hypothetical protein
VGGQNTKLAHQFLLKGENMKYLLFSLLFFLSACTTENTPPENVMPTGVFLGIILLILLGIGLGALIIIFIAAFWSEADIPTPWEWAYDKGEALGERLYVWKHRNDPPPPSNVGTPKIVKQNYPFHYPSGYVNPQTGKRTP